MPFSPQTLDFLTENRLNDSKIWFNEHKSDYEEYVKKTFIEFTEKMRPYIDKIDEDATVTRISRIYRDTRFAKGKSVFRENMWCFFGRVRDLYQALPGFYCDLSVNGFEYGCGFYMASTQTMENMRSMIISGSPLFDKAQQALESQDSFSLYGDMYKRNRFPEQPEEKQLWLNRKNIGITALSTDWELIFSDSLADKVGEDFLKIADIYRFILTAAEMNNDIIK